MKPNPVADAWLSYDLRDSLHGKCGRYIKKDPVSGLPGLQALECEGVVGTTNVGGGPLCRRALFTALYP